MKISKNIKYMNIFFIFLLVFGIIYINYITKTRESMDNNNLDISMNSLLNTNNKILDMNISDSFCKVNKSSSKLNKSCAKLTDSNCNLTSCCVWANKKCVAGDKSGPTYNTDSNGKSINHKYYFKNVCYGEKC